MENHGPFSAALRARLAQRGIRPDRDPASYPASAEILGLTPSALGYDRFASALHRLRAACWAAAGGNYAIRATRDPTTGQRTGYAVCARTQAVADQIARRIAASVPGLIVR